MTDWIVFNKMFAIEIISENDALQLPVWFAGFLAGFGKCSSSGQQVVALNRMPIVDRRNANRTVHRHFGYQLNLAGALVGLAVQF